MIADHRTMSLAPSVSLPSWENPPEMGLTYGPVQSRRLGLSLGINPLGHTKICSFDCPYCELGLTQVRMNQIKKEIQFPSVEEIDQALREKLRSLNNEGVALNHLTLSGNGEPTLYPYFLELTERLIKARDELASEVPLVILTNGAHIDNRRTVHALDMYDNRMIKVDAGSDKDMKLINNPLVRSNLSKIIGGARKLKDCIVQSCFVSGSISNIGETSIADWIEVVGIIRPKAVHIYNLRRHPSTAGLEMVDEDTLYTIASKLKRRTQLESEVFP